MKRRHMYLLTPLSCTLVGALAFVRHNHPTEGDLRPKCARGMSAAPYRPLPRSHANFGPQTHDRTLQLRVEASSSQSARVTGDPTKTVSGSEILSWLCDVVNATPSDRLALTTENGVRGVFLNPPYAQKDDILLQIPLSSCLRDDEPPDWFYDGTNTDEDNRQYSVGSEWAARLAACMLDRQLTPERNLDEGIQRWLSLLPEAALLRVSLPIHWSDEIVRSCQCAALELAVDSAYFARAEVIEELVNGLRRSSHDLSRYDALEITTMCHDALDIVQTRCCKVSVNDTPVRLLAPVFDMINHGGGALRPNALYDVEGNSLIVRATRSMKANEQVLIDYGKSSAGTPWKCLVYYGFVPDTHPETSAELQMDGVRGEVRGDSVPLELIEAASAVLSEGGDDPETIDNPLTAVACRISEQALRRAHNLLVDPELSQATAFDEISKKLATSLRQSEHKVLTNLAHGLREYSVRMEGNSGRSV